MHNRERVTTVAKPKVILRGDEVTYTTDTVLFTTDEMGEPVFVKEVDYHQLQPDGSTSGPFVIQQQSAKASSKKDLPQFAATSLLQLSQMKSDEDNTAGGTVIVDPESVIEIPGQEGGFVFVTTSDNEQKLMPLSQLSSFIAAQSNEAQ